MKRSITFLSLYFISTLVLAEQYPWELLKEDSKFRKSYHAMLGKKVHEKWLATLSGPSTPVTKVTVLDVEYLYLHSCKPHDCGENNIVIIYSPKSLRIYGKLVEQGAITKLGKPSKEIGTELDRLYDEQFGNSESQSSP
jgi:hypothetical protein